MSTDFLPPPVPPKFAIDYIKSTGFHTSHVDGVIGSITPAGKLHMICFSERAAIPRRQVFLLNEEGKIVAPIHNETVSRGSIVREVDVDLVMDINVAEDLLRWLNDRVNELRATRDVSIKNANGEGT